MARADPGGWKPSQHDFARVLAEQNPWFRDGEVPEALGHRHERFLARNLYRRLLGDEPHRFHLLIGPRRVGKTTAMYQTVRHLIAAGVSPHRIAWLNLAHPVLIDRPLGDLVQSFIGARKATPESPVYFCLDELSYAERWDLWLKELYDRKLPLRIVATSSATAILHGARHESGVGRWEEHFLPPYLFGEYLDLVEQPAEIERHDTLAATLRELSRFPPELVDLTAARRRFMLLGGFPELLLSPDLRSLDESSALLKSQSILRSDAVQKALYQDIPQAYDIGRPVALERMLYALAGQIAGILRPESLSSSLGLSVPTFEKYLRYLEHSFLVFTTPNFSASEESIQRRGRKLYFVDPAVRNAALQRGIGPLSDLREMGLLIENLVASHLFALAETSGHRLFHWRQGQRAEVDLVLAHPSDPLAIEVGSSVDHDAKGPLAFLQRFPAFSGQVYLAAPGAVAVAPRTDPPAPGVISVEHLLLAVSRHAEEELAQKLRSPIAAGE